MLLKGFALEIQYVTIPEKRFLNIVLHQLQIKRYFLSSNSQIKGSVVCVSYSKKLEN